jgi:class 3 adenylate cyclase/tetratricopeptide (TPR) repeat protein
MYKSIPGNVSDARWELEDYRREGTQANKEGEALRAYDFAAQGLRVWQDDAVLKRIQALALARMGSRREAFAILQRIDPQRDSSEEMVGLLARIYKDQWLATGRIADLQLAWESYVKAYNDSPEKYWSGINAATLGFKYGAHDDARKIGKELIGVCREKLEHAPADERYYLAATIAEAHLLLQQLPEAELWYKRAAELGNEHFGDILTTWANARILLSSMPPEVHSRMNIALQVPRVAVFAGHRIDEPGRELPRFPENRAESVKEGIRVHLLETRARIGFSSAASGSDILFLEAMQSLGGRTYIVLPCNQEQFIEESVGSSDSWVARFQAVVKRAAEVIIVSPSRLSIGSVAYDFASDVLYGQALSASRQNGTKLFHLAVWDGREGDGRGGTADIINLWRQRTDDITVVGPNSESIESGSRLDASVISEQRLRTREPQLLGIRSEVRALLFADAYLFSQLSETQVVAFIEQFMNSIAMLIQQTHPAPLFQNTWGDGLYIVFREVGEAGKFALNLKNRIASVDRARAGLPHDLTLRIALHAGPVYVYKDGITDRVNYMGSHVNRAARVEPVTPPGLIYVTDAFRALAEIYAPGEFRFTYVGKTSLAKNYGAVALYSLSGTE